MSLAPGSSRGAQFETEIRAQGVGVPHTAPVLVDNPTQDGLIDPGLPVDLVSALSTFLNGFSNGFHNHTCEFTSCLHLLQDLSLSIWDIFPDALAINAWISSTAYRTAVPM